MAAKSEVRGILVECAKRRNFITYSQLVPRITAFKVEFRGPCLDALLAEISIAEEQHGRGLLSVLVVHKIEDRRPGQGFYELAVHLGHHLPDTTYFWVYEFNRVFDYWKNHPDENP